MLIQLAQPLAASPVPLPRGDQILHMPPGEPGGPGALGGWCFSGWWFGTFVIFPYIGNNHPNWLIFFTGVQTTNQVFCFPSTLAVQVSLGVRFSWPEKLGNAVTLFDETFLMTVFSCFIILICAYIYIYHYITVDTLFVPDHFPQLFGCPTTGFWQVILVDSRWLAPKSSGEKPVVNGRPKNSWVNLVWCCYIYIYIGISLFFHIGV